MSTSVPPPSNWPLRPDSKLPRRDLSAEILELRREPARGKLTGLSVAIAEWLGIDVLLVRTLVVITSLSAGVGALGYLAGWAMTRDANTGLAPLDKLGDRWRQVAPRTVVGFATGVVLLFGLTFGSIVGFGWLPLIVIGLTVMTGLRLPPAKPRPVRPQFAPAPNAGALPPGAYAVPPPRRPTWPITVGTLCVAALAGGAVFEADPMNIVRPAAVTLLIIGLGLLLAARRGTAVGLVLAGVVITVTMGGLALLAPSGGQNPSAVAEYGEVHYFDSLDQVPNEMVFDSQMVTVDLGVVGVTAEHDLYVTANDSSITVIMPMDANVQVLLDYTDSFFWVHDQLEFGSGSLHQTNQPYPDQPTFTVHIQATGSRIEVI